MTAQITQISYGRAIFNAAVFPVVFSVTSLGISALTICSGLFGYLAKRAATDVTRGVVGGTTDGIQTAIENAVEGAFTKLKSDFQDINIGKSAGEGLKELVNEFIAGTGVDSTGSAQTISTNAENFIKNLKLGGMVGVAGDQVNDAFETAFDNFDLGGKARRVGDELRDALNQGTKPLGKGAREAASNILGEVAKGVTLDILPWVAAGIMLVTAAPLSMYYFYHRAKHYIGSPKLATEVHQRTIFTPLTESVKNATSWALGSEPKPIFNADITRRITDITRATNNIRRNGGYFQNVLFYGPGGTGKTMISSYIAKNSGMSYVKMSGGDLAQYIKRGEHVTELNKLLDKMNCSWRPWSTRPWILFIDEAESLLRDRSKIPTAELLELQNAFLNRTGTQSTRFGIFLATNRMEDLDEAVLSRMDHKIYVGPPAETERVEIFKSYIPKFFTRSERASFFEANQIGKIAKMTAGLTGRAIFKLLNDIANKKAATNDRKLTQAMIDLTIGDFMRQEQEVEKRRAQKEAIENGVKHQATLVSSAVSTA